MSDLELRRMLSRWVGYIDAINQMDDNEGRQAGFRLAVKVLREDLRRRGIPTPPVHYCSYDACAGDPEPHTEGNCPTAAFDIGGAA